MLVDLPSQLSMKRINLLPRPAARQPVWLVLLVQFVRTNLTNLANLANLTNLGNLGMILDQKHILDVVA